MIPWLSVKKNVLKPDTSKDLIFFIFLILISFLAARLLSLRFDIQGMEAVRIGFGSIPVLLGSIWLGPWWGLFIGAGSDLLIFVFHPEESYVFLITLVSALRGFLPGFLGRFTGNITRVRSLFVQIGVTQVVCSVILMPLALYQAFQIPVIDNMTTRALAQAFTIPIYLGIIYVLITQLKSGEVLQESEERARLQRAAIAGLVTDNVVVTGQIPTALCRITEVLSDTIGVERASIWTLDEEGIQLQCLSLFEGGERKHSKGAVLEMKEFPRYFEAIFKEGRIYTENAQKDPRTSQLTEGYLKPLGIISMLDAGIVIEGKLKGVVSLEHVGAPRKWHADEEAFASTMAALAAQVFINAERREINNSLQFQLTFEKIISEISSYFVSLTGEQLDEGINYALQRTGELFQVDRSYLFQFSADGETMNNTHEWCAEGIEPQSGNIQNQPVESLPWWTEQIRTGDHVYIPDVDRLGPEAEAEKKDFQSQGIRSLLCLPVIKNGSLFGFFGFDAVKEKRAWSDEHIVLLKVIAELITNALTRHQADDTIRYLSFHDRLTDLYNRHYMEEQMNRLDTERQFPISLIMADLNGLKLVNDTCGHEKGDEMLKIAADILRKSCREEDIIARWGGDEFIILLPQTTAEEAGLLCKRITVNCSEVCVGNVPVSIALGSASKVDETKNLAETLREAEDEMYKLKLSQSRSTKNALLQALLKTLAEKSFETEARTRRMQKMAQIIGEKLNLSDAELNRLNLLIILQDIGKINIAEEILTKESALTAEEWETIKKHPEIGFRISRATEDFAYVAEEILTHHEHWDGSGYPKGLKGTEIPLLSRIASIVAAFEAMTQGRPYKEPRTHGDAAAELKRCTGSQFDPELVEVFLSTLEE